MDSSIVEIVGVAATSFTAGMGAFKLISDWYTANKRKLEVDVRIPENADSVIEMREEGETEDEIFQFIGNTKLILNINDPRESSVKIIITSVCKKTVVLHSYGIQVYNPDTSEYINVKTWDINQELLSTRSHTIFLSMGELISILKTHGYTRNVKLRFYVKDEKNIMYYCDLIFDYNYWEERIKLFTVLTKIPEDKFEKIFNVTVKQKLINAFSKTKKY